MKLIKFLKLDFKKIVFLLILISPLIALFLPGLLPAQFSILNTYLKSNYIVFTSFLMPLCFVFGSYDCWAVGMDLPFWYNHVAIAGSFLIAVLFWYLISCLIVLTWNKIFGYFREKSKLYEKNAGIFLLFLFIFIAVVLPIIGTYFVTMEKSTRPAISIDEAYHGNIKLQELKVRNSFILPVVYKLPDVTVCLHDIEGNLTLGYTIAYRTEDGQFVEDMDEFHRNVVVLRPDSEIKIYLQEFIGILGNGSEKFVYEEREKYDEFLLLANIGMDNYNYCYDANEDDILISEKIKILK